MSWPDNLEPYRRTKDFTQDTVPQGLLSEHTTRKGAWAMLNVVAGELDFVDDVTGRRETLGPSKPGFIQPEREHHIEIDKDVTFYIEFYRERADEDD